MDQLTTEAGRRHLDAEMHDRLLLVIGGEVSPEREVIGSIAAIEDEARDQAVTLRIAAIEANARAELAARIEARLRAEPTPPRLYALSAWDLDCVLAAIHEEAERA